MFYETFKTKKWIKKTDFQVHGAQLKHHGIWTLHFLLICKARMTPPKVFSINIYLNSLMFHKLWITPLPLCIMKPISRSILNCKFVGAPWPYARLGLWGPAYLHKIKTSHGLKITNCMKICTGRNGPFLGAKTLLWKIINNVISNTNQKGVSRDREDETKITLVQLYATYIRRIDFDIFVKLAIKIFGNFLLIHMVKLWQNIETNYFNIGLPMLDFRCINYTGQFGSGTS